VVATNEARGEQDEDGAPKKNGLLTRVMGLDDAPDTYSGLRAATMERSAKELGRQFLLSDREIEVVTLYALGYTQQRVAEELFISPGTVHAHIKRIYAKTGLHSRQAILDYLQQYAD
jgi:DNA-binding CsgD family transcriptional regulator